MSIARYRLLSIFKHAHFARMRNVRYGCCANKKSEIVVNQRALDHKVRVTHIITRPLRITSQDQSRDLMAVWPNVVRDITSVSQELNLPDVTERLTRVLEYNFPGGNNMSASTLLYAYETLTPTNQITPENDYQARILAWCMELWQAFLFMMDDIVNQSLIRRKQICWYRYEGIGLTAINDAVMIENVTYQLLRKYLKERDCYIDILEACQDSMVRTLMGQCLEINNFGKTLYLDRFTMDRYDDIVYYKTAYYSFVLPVTVGMHFAGIKDQELFRQVTAILLRIGHLSQIQDDYLSCYGDREIFGKIDTDIEEGKCTWLAVTALQHATPVQQNLFKECYGSTDPEKVRRVRQLYNDLDLPKIYSTYEKETYDLLNIDIQRMLRELPQKLLQNILNDIYRRTK